MAAAFHPRHAPKNSPGNALGRITWCRRAAVGYISKLIRISMIVCVYFTSPNLKSWSDLGTMGSLEPDVGLVATG